MTETTQGYKTLKELANILVLFLAHGGEEQSVANIARALKAHPSKVSRMLKTLGGEGFFEKSAGTGKYRLGLPFFELGVASISNWPLRKVIRPHIEQIAKELNVGAGWAVLKGRKVILVDRVRNISVYLLSHQMGLNIPLHCSSAGKLLLAYLEPEEQEAILKNAHLRRYTDRTIVDVDALRENLKVIREKGYSLDEGESFEDLQSIAAPIRNDQGTVIAAINIIVDQSTGNSRENLLEHAEYLKEKALFISRQSGYGTGAM